MTQNTEQNMRTRKQQIEDAYLNDGDFTLFQEFDRDDFEAQLHEAEARGAEEQRRKDAEELEAVAWLIQDKSKGKPGRAYSPDYAVTHKPYADMLSRHGDNVSALYTRPANVAALEAEIASLKEAEQLARADAEASKARVKVLEAENAVLQARKIDAAPEPVPYSDPIRTMSTEQLCQRLQVLRARWDELMDSDEEMGGGSPMESMDEEMQSLENEISRRAALTREGGV